MMRYYYLLISIFLVISMHAQTLTMGSLTTDDGMSNGSARCVYKDARGHVFIGTDIGVDRFDGEKVVKVPVKGPIDAEKSDVNCIIGETEQTLLVGTQMGLWRLDTRRLVMERVFAKEINFEVTSAVRAVDGTMYLGTINGLYMLKGHTLKSVDLYRGGSVKGRYIQDIAYYHHGKKSQVWLALRKSVICVDASNNTVQQYCRLYSVDDGVNRLTQIAVSETGRVFVGTSNDGVWEFLSDKESFQPYLCKGRQITSLFYGPDHHLLVATGFHGAYDIDLSSNKEVCSYSTRGGTDDVKTRFDSPHVFYRDSLGGDWIGYQFFGLDYSFYNRKTFQVYRIPGVFDSSDVNVRSFLHDGTKMLLGTRHGLYVVDEAARQLRIIGEEVLNACVVSRIRRIGNHYYVGTINGGLHLLDVTTLTDKTPADIRQQLAGSNIYDFDVDQKGQVWIGSTAGLMRYHPGSDKYFMYTTRNSQLPDNEVLSIGIDGYGNVWISTYQGGVSYYHATSDAILGKQTMSVNAAKMSTAISAEHLRGNLMLFLPLRDFPVIYEESIDSCYQVKLDIPLDHPRSQYYHLFPDQSYIYGVKEGLYLGRRNQFRKFCYLDGLPCQQFQPHGYQLDSDSIFWVATNGGLVYAQLQDMMKRDLPHIPILLNDVISDHIYSEVENNEVNYSGRIQLTRRKSSFAVRFLPLVLCNVKDIAFRYRLEGYEEEWHQTGNDHSVYYTSLWPGEYQLRIEAIDVPEINTTIAVSVPVTWAAMIRLLLLLLLLSIVGHIVYCKVRKKKYIWERLMPKPEKYQTSRMDKREAERLVKALKTYMDDYKPYRRPDLTMADLAKAVGCSSHTLSQLFSQHLNRNYYDFIAEYRVNEFKRLAADPKYASLTITALSEKCGFASRNPFLTAFKKFTGMTPKDYVKSVQK